MGVLANELPQMLAVSQRKFLQDRINSAIPLIDEIVSQELKLVKSGISALMLTIEFIKGSLDGLRIDLTHYFPDVLKLSAKSSSRRNPTSFGDCLLEPWIFNRDLF